MDTLVLASICMHMLLWAGCQSASELHMIRSHGSLLRQAIDSSQIYRSSWRKLLEEGSVTSSVGVQEITNASFSAESKTVEETHESTHIAEKPDVVDVQKNSTISDEHEEAKADTTLLNAQMKEGRSEGISNGFGSANKTYESKSKPDDASVIDDLHKVEARNNTEESKAWLAAINSDTDTVKPESNGNQGALKEQRPETDATTVDKGKVVKIQVEAETGGKPAFDGDKTAEGEVVIASTNQDHSNGIIAEKFGDAQNADATGMKESFQMKNESSVGLPKSMSTAGNSSTSITENNTYIKLETQTDKNRNIMEGNNFEEEKRSSRENTVLEGQLAEGEPKNMVASLDTEKVGQIAHDIMKTIDNLNISTTGFEETGRNKETDDKNESRESLEEKETKAGDGREISSHLQNAKVEEMQDVHYDNGNVSSNSNDTNGSDNKVNESQGLSDMNNEKGDDDNGMESDGNDPSVFVKSDDETEAASKEVELQLEALKRDTVIETSVEQMHEMDPSEDEYDIIQELADLPTKFQETAGKVADRLRPGVIKWTDTSKVYFNRANQHMTERFSPLLGKQYAPFVASVISYSILLLPLIVVILLFEHIKALFSLQKVLLFINIYLAAYFATLWLASYIIGLEPMSFFYLNSLSSFLSLQLLQGLGYLIYLILQTANIIHSCTSDVLVGKLSSTLQWTVAMSIGLHYYVTVFHPAIVSKPPHTSWKCYATYSSAFFILCLSARIRWVKKQYLTSGSNVGDKKS